MFFPFQQMSVMHASQGHSKGAGLSIISVLMHVRVDRGLLFRTVQTSQDREATASSICLDSFRRAPFPSPSISKATKLHHGRQSAFSMVPSTHLVHARKEEGRGTSSHFQKLRPIWSPAMGKRGGGAVRDISWTLNSTFLADPTSSKRGTPF